MYDNDIAFRDEHCFSDGDAEYTVGKKLYEMSDSADITVSEQHFKINATYHKLDFKESDKETEIQTLIDDLSSFDTCKISVISESDFNSSKTDSSSCNALKTHTEEFIKKMGPFWDGRESMTW